MGANTTHYLCLVWKERNKKAFDGVEDIDESDILQNRLFQKNIYS